MKIHPSVVTTSDGTSLSASAKERAQKAQRPWIGEGYFAAAVGFGSGMNVTV
ncbi:MAG: hypothetical protein QOC95_1756 [Thermoleophilaceae bacterium]|jgi:hypothetical protein|nr:hypothetical protein [Thermoleophilaceae bacterium]